MFIFECTPTGGTTTGDIIERRTIRDITPRTERQYDHVFAIVCRHDTGRYQAVTVDARGAIASGPSSDTIDGVREYITMRAQAAAIHIGQVIDDDNAEYSDHYSRDRFFGVVR